MTALKMEELERLEEKYGLEPDGLTYQHRCSRVAAYEEGRGDEWTIPPKTERRQMQEAIQEQKNNAAKRGPRGETISRISTHPLFGKVLLLCPLMTPDKNRNLSYDEPLGPEMNVEEVNAGEMLHSLDDSADRMFSDYRIKSIDNSKKVIAITGFPKIGTELTYRIGYDKVPVVRGNKNDRGYIWSMPTTRVQIEDTIIEMMGLKTLITAVAPELLPKFKNKPMMSYIDGITLAANIPMTEAELKEYQEKELIREKAGLGY